MTANTFKGAGKLSRGATRGELLQANGDFVYLRNDANLQVMARGLVFFVEPEIPETTAAAEPGQFAATVEVELGRADGGGRAVRRFTLTPRGAWFSAVGWSSIRVHVLACDAGSVVSYAWTREQPPDAFPLTLIEAIAPGVHAIPKGAARLALSVADAGWTWRTKIGAAGALDLLAAQPGGRDLFPVLGSLYVATVANVAAWELDPT